MERLQKVIANYGYTSRRKAEELILKGEVSVNGQIITTLGAKVDSKDEIKINGEIIKKSLRKEYYMLNKPREVLSTVKDEKGRKTVLDIVKSDERIYPIGRLDYDTIGLILLTNDGKLANILMHPSSKIYKTYVAKINGILKEEDFLKIRKGPLIENRKLIVTHMKVKNVDKLKNTSLVEITIHEGRNHIIRKLFAYLGYDVLKLSRIKYANLSLGNLKSGEYRKLSSNEVKALYELSNFKK